MSGTSDRGKREEIFLTEQTFSRVNSLFQFCPMKNNLLFVADFTHDSDHMISLLSTSSVTSVDSTVVIVR